MVAALLHSVAATPPLALFDLLELFAHALALTPRMFPLHLEPPLNRTPREAAATIMRWTQAH
eukprot:13511920-Alexandrium_andersonii.AAC.1